MARSKNKVQARKVRTKLAGAVDLHAEASAYSIADELQAAGRNYYRDAKAQAEIEVIEDAVQDIACALEGRSGGYFGKAPKAESVTMARRILTTLRTLNNRLAGIEKTYGIYGV